MKNKITPWDILNYSLQNIFFKGIEVDIAGVQKSEETIANFQWFLRRPSPLNVFGLSDHCHQWFYDDFLMLLPSLSMVFDGSVPLVKRCDGFDGSLWSIPGTAVTPDQGVILFFLNPSHPSPLDVFGLQVLVNLLTEDGSKMTSHSNAELFRLIPTPFSWAPVVAATSVPLPTTRTGKNTGGFAIESVAW